MLVTRVNRGTVRLPILGTGPRMTDHDGEGFRQSVKDDLARDRLLRNNRTNTFEPEGVLGSQDPERHTARGVLHGHEPKKQHNLHLLRD